MVEILEPTGAKLPKTLDEVDFVECATPLSFAHYYSSEKGAFYGLDHDLNRFKPATFYLRLRPEIPEVPGLFLAGQDIATCGVGGALIGGLLCAQKVLGVRNPMSLLRKEQDNDAQEIQSRINEEKEVTGNLETA